MSLKFGAALPALEDAAEARVWLSDEGAALVGAEVELPKTGGGPALRAPENAAEP